MEFWRKYKDELEIAGNLVFLVVFLAWGFVLPFYLTIVCRWWGWQHDVGFIAAIFTISTVLRFKEYCGWSPYYPWPIISIFPIVTYLYVGPPVWGVPPWSLLILFPLGALVFVKGHDFVEEKVFPFLYERKKRELGSRTG